jgi:hypothetical protein
MSLLLTLTVKGSAVLSLALWAARVLQGRSAGVRHWILSAGVAAACLVPLIHTLPGGPAAHVIPRLWELASIHETASNGPTESLALTVIDTSGAAPSGRETRSTYSRTIQPPQTAQPGDRDGVSLGDAVVMIWVSGVVISGIPLLLGLARLRSLSASSPHVASGPGPQLCRGLARASGVSRPVALLSGQHPALVVTWGTS